MAPPKWNATVAEFVQTATMPTGWNYGLEIENGRREKRQAIFNGTENGTEAAIAWEGDSREVIRDFPEEIKEELGIELQCSSGETSRAATVRCHPSGKACMSFDSRTSEAGIESYISHASMM